ncbi:MAG: FliG C-terminal domain-containing protein [Planctomycetota bacterium]
MASKEQIGGAAKVATFLLTLEREEAARILHHLGEDVVAEVVEAMEEIDPKIATDDVVQGIYEEVAAMRYEGNIRPTTSKELESLLQAGLGAERAASVLALIEKRHQMERPFLQVERMAPRALLRALENESPAAIAVVLAHIDPRLSAFVLGGFEVERALDIVKRMATLTPPSFEVLELLAEDLFQRMQQFAGEPEPRGSSERLQSIAELLNNSSAQIGSGVLDGISDSDADMATEIRNYMFTWDDIGDIDRRAMQQILGSVDTRTLAIALKACRPEVEENIVSNLSSRVKDMVKEERELAGAVPMSEVLQSREEIMRNVRAMIESGEFRPAKGGDELVS